MARYIDADALLESLVYCDGLGRKSFEAVIKHINEQPTAFDLDKVVQELEELEIHTEHYNISLYKDYPDVKRRYEQTCRVIDKAIEIVRNGGKE